MKPTWLNQLKAARKLPNTELERHAAVARLEGSSRCLACFCCAAEAVLKERADRGMLLRGALMQIHVTRSGIGGVYGHPVTRCDAGGCAAGTEFYFPELVPSQWKEGDIADDGQREPDDKTPAVLSLGPTPCVNCGSPACEWPGECKPVGQLPIVEIDGTPYYRDDRLEEFRNVDDRARAIRDRLVVK